MKNIAYPLLLVAVFFSPLASGKEKLIVLVNPNAGGGQAQSYYERNVKPLLIREYELTEYCDSNVDIAQIAIESAGNDLLSFKGILGVGGDGTIHEIYKALLGSRFSRDAVERIAVGHIPCGSGNALARSIYEQSCHNSKYDAISLVAGVVHGKTMPIDLWSYETDTGLRGIFFLGISLGVISDIDIGSEWLRPYIGSWRFDAYGAMQWLQNRNYDYELSHSCKGESSTRKSSTRELWAMNIPFASEKVRVAPDAELNDGLLHILLVNSETSWLQLYTFLQSLNEGNAHALPFVEVLHADTLTLATSGSDRVTIDGELLPPNVKSINVTRLPIQGRVFEATCLR